MIDFDYEKFEVQAKNILKPECLYPGNGGGQTRCRWICRTAPCRRGD